jgi:hypothetical protein
MSFNNRIKVESDKMEISTDSMVNGIELNVFNGCINKKFITVYTTSAIANAQIIQGFIKSCNTVLKNQARNIKPAAS